MKNIAIIALLGATHASEASTNTASRTTNTNANMAASLVNADLDLKEFSTKEEEEEEDNSTAEESQVLIKNHGRDRNGMFKNHKNFVMMRNKINDQESKHQSMFDTINKKLADDNFISQAIQMTAFTTSQDTVSSNAPDGMSEADLKCYNENYSDCGGADNARTHYTTIGHEQGRQPNCGRSLTPTEEQVYLDKYPDLQHSFGRSGTSATRQAHTHFIDYGYAEKRNPSPWTGYNAEPQFCIDGDKVGEQDSCKCDGTTWYGRAKDEAGNRITTWDKFRMWPSLSKTEENKYLRCNKYTFGEVQGLKDQPRACWCEPKPNYIPTICAEKAGDECLCNGRVIFGQRDLHAKSGDHALGDLGVDGVKVTRNYWTVNNFNNTAKQVCAASTFEGVDPLPHKDKRCYCDEQNKTVNANLEQAVKKYWRTKYREREIQAEKIRAEALAAAATKKAEEERIAEEERMKKEKEEREAKEEQEKKDQEEKEKLAKLENDSKLLDAANRKIKKLEKAKKSAEEAAAAEKKKQAADKKQAELDKKLQAEKNVAKKQELIKEMEEEKKKGIQAAVDAEIAKARAEREKLEAESEEEATKAKAEADRKEKAALAEQRRKAAKAAEEADAAHQRELDSRAHAAAEARAALAEKYKAELEKQLADSLEEQKKAFEDQQKEQEKTRKEEAEKKARAQAVLLAEKQKQEKAAEEENKKKEEEEKKAEQEQLDAEKAQAKKKIDAEKEKLRLKKEEFAKKQKIAKAKAELMKAQLEEEKAQTTEEVKAAQEKAAAATKAAEEAEKERQQTLAEQKVLEEEIDQAQLRVAEAKKAQEAAKKATAEAKDNAAAWKKRAQDAKEKAAKEMAEDEEEAKEKEAELKKEAEEQKKKHEDALAAQAVAYKKAEEQAKSAAKAAEQNRKNKMKQAIAEQKKLMEQRKSDFAKTYAHTWDIGMPNVSMFEFTAAEIGFAQQIITKLFYNYAIADVQIIKRPITRTYLENDVVNFAGGDYKIIGVTTDDRRQEVIRIVNEAQSDDRYPVSDTRFWAIATGNKDYILWVKDQTKDKGTDAEDIKSFLPEGTAASNDAQPNTGVDGNGETEAEIAAKKKEVGANGDDTASADFANVQTASKMKAEEESDDDEEEE